MLLLTRKYAKGSQRGKGREARHAAINLPIPSAFAVAPSSPVEVVQGKHDYWSHVPGQTSYLKTEVKHSFQEQIQTIKLPI